MPIKALPRHTAVHFPIASWPPESIHLTTRTTSDTSFPSTKERHRSYTQVIKCAPTNQGTWEPHNQQKPKSIDLSSTKNAYHYLIETDEPPICHGPALGHNKYGDTPRFRLKSKHNLLTDEKFN